MSRRITSIIVIASCCVQIFAQTNSIEFQDTVANQKTGAIGYKGTASNGYIFIETPNSQDVKVQNGSIITQGNVTAAKFYKGSAEFDSVRAAVIADSCKKIPSNVKFDTAKVAQRADSLGALPANNYALKKEIKNNVDSLGGIPASRFLSTTDLIGKNLKIDSIYVGTDPQYDPIPKDGSPAEQPNVQICPHVGAAKLRLATRGNFQSGLEFFHDGTQAWYIYNEPSKGELRFWNDQDRLFLNQQGNFGIGTSASTYKLEVAGDAKCETLRAKEVVVDGAKINVPDYVFDKNYKLKTLDEVGVFISENKHLPDIQSAQELKENGVDIVKLNLDLLKKVEELTLYILEQNKKIDGLQKEIVDVKANQIGRILE